MYSLILQGRRSLELQKWFNLLQIASSYSNSNSISSVSAAHVSPQDGRKEKTFTVSYLVDSLGFTTKLAESISRKVISEGKGNPYSVLSLLKSYRFTVSDLQHRPVHGKERFEESLKKVVEMGFDPTTSKFVHALCVVYQMSDKTIEEKLNVYKRLLGLDVGDVWEIFKKCPLSLSHSEQKVLDSVETFLGVGFTIDEVRTMVKCFPQCIAHSAELVKMKIEFVVKKMNWPLKAVASHPQVLGYSMEKRIVPRCNVIKALMSKGLLRAGGSKLPSVWSVLACTDQAFVNKYVTKYDDKELVRELMPIFTKNHNACQDP
ncbi:unnamed protein product [Thlaspi arvense]|uniref:Mitochondrial transcription termination factor family protein n=1 Tax=Thlaspi arvense TaxID=13288 RepID=A0AAU9RVC5_THLAR|nr:unnamed protein product [Thlaspi arvense]